MVLSPALQQVVRVLVNDPERRSYVSGPHSRDSPDRLVAASSRELDHDFAVPGADMHMRRLVLPRRQEDCDSKTPPRSTVGISV